MKGPAVRMVAAGSGLKLVCVVKEAPPTYVFWYQGARMINYDVDRGVNTSLDRDHSILTVASVTESHAGNYTCAPDNASPSSVLVHVVVETDESPSSGRGSQKGVNKTPVRQLGVKSASSAGPRVLLPQTLALFLLGLLLCDALMTFPRVFHSSL
ncbi:hypothetical protein Pmani_039138 [Petrolisthes manimaculis]|uniref:Ig-like domain-containing protein n=1 Tax=Petrolisthes manimaculis TaxID=1843537 RepID=A0AAE1ND94_9EUCA|nr:hypothetical protein Pmani_039138 [Petrolisthes manimaculis]